MDLMKLQNGSDIRGVAIDGVEGEYVNLTADIAAKIGCAFVSWLSGKIKKACDRACYWRWPRFSCYRTGSCRRSYFWNFEYRCQGRKL